MLVMLAIILFFILFCSLTTVFGSITVIIEPAFLCKRASNYEVQISTMDNPPVCFLDAITNKKLSIEGQTDADNKYTIPANSRFVSLLKENVPFLGPDRDQVQVKVRSRRRRITVSQI